MSLVPDDRANDEELERTLSMEQRLQVKEIRDMTAEFLRACDRIGRSRELALAKTNAQQASFWAVEHITGEKTDGS